LAAVITGHAAPAQADGAVINGDVDLYDVPGGTGRVIGMLRQGLQIELVEPCRSDNWCHVQQGWVWGDFVTISDQPPPEAMHSVVLVPQEIFSPPSPSESSSEAAKRVESLLTHELFLAMSQPKARDPKYDYKMGLVAQQHGTVTAQAYIDDHGVRDGDDTKNSVSRTVIVIQDIKFPDGRSIEDKFGLLVDVVLDDGKWKAKSIAPQPALDVLQDIPPGPTTPTTPSQPR
jgi:hypothetical protein